MRVLLFLILGTLVFGLAFPAFILIVGFLLLMFAFAAIFIMLSSVFGGKNVIIYKNGRRVDPFGDRDNSKHTADNPEIIVNRNHTDDDDVYAFGQDAESEVIELPADALSKEDKEED